jgi:molybdopterin converting factor subunit 1
MQVKLIAFGIARDILQSGEILIEAPGERTVGELKALLMRRYPEFERLRSLRLAVNSEYVGEDRRLRPGDEVVLIPPVSGG